MESGQIAHVRNSGQDFVLKGGFAEIPGQGECVVSGRHGADVIGRISRRGTDCQQVAAIRR